MGQQQAPAARRPVGGPQTSQNARQASQEALGARGEGEMVQSHPQGIEEEPQQPSAMPPERDLDYQLDTWLEANATTGEPPRFYLYKDDGKGRGLWPFCAQYSEYPDRDDIGRNYGGGNYQLMVAVGHGPNKRTDSYCFRLASTYDDIRRLQLQAAQVEIAKQQAAASRAAAAPPAPQMIQAPSPQDPTAALQASVGIISSIVKDIVAPLLKKETAPAQDPTGVTQIMAKQAADMSQMVVKSAIDNSRAFRQAVIEMQQDQQDQEEDEEEDEVDQTETVAAVEQQPSEPEPDVIDWLCGMAEQYGPTILGEDTPATKALIAIVKAAPAWRRMVAQPSDLARVVGALDSKMGPAKVDRWLAKLGVQRPQ